MKQSQEDTSRKDYHNSNVPNSNQLPHFCDVFDTAFSKKEAFQNYIALRMETHYLNTDLQDDFLDHPVPTIPSAKRNIQFCNVENSVSTAVSYPMLNIPDHEPEVCNISNRKSIQWRAIEESTQTTEDIQSSKLSSILPPIYTEKDSSSFRWSKKKEFVPNNYLQNVTLESFLATTSGKDAAGISPVSDLKVFLPTAGKQVCNLKFTSSTGDSSAKSPVKNRLENGAIEFVAASVGIKNQNFITVADSVYRNTVDKPFFSNINERVNTECIQSNDHVQYQKRYTSECIPLYYGKNIYASNQVLENHSSTSEEVPGIFSSNGISVERSKNTPTWWFNPQGSDLTYQNIKNLELTFSKNNPFDFTKDNSILQSNVDEFDLSNKEEQCTKFTHHENNNGCKINSLWRESKSAALRINKISGSSASTFTESISAVAEHKAAELVTSSNEDIETEQFAFSENTSSKNATVRRRKYSSHVNKRPVATEKKKRSRRISPLRNNSFKKTKNKSDVWCDICHRSFKWRSHLIIHRRTHTGERPYICFVCKKSYTQYGALNRHRRIKHLKKRLCASYSCKKI